MGRKLPGTPKSRVRAAIRQLWLRSRERAAAIQREGGCCEECGKKQSKAKGREVSLEVHHLNGIEWSNIIDYIYRHVLVDPKHLQVLCKECHEELHKEDV
jgi:predicted HNH restriction endonuclease